MTDLKSFIEQIKALAPELVYQNAILDDSGQFNDVIKLDEAWIFRFPRFPDGIQQLRVETDLLLALIGRLLFPIPNPVYTCFHPPEPGKACIGYHRLPGEPLLTPAHIGSHEGLKHIAGQLANFLRSMHAIPPYSLGVELRVADGVNNWISMYDDVRARLFPAMRPQAREQISRHFEDYLGDRTRQTFGPALRHGDFGGSNILYDPNLYTITGVLDFSSCALGDPAYDLASVSTLGEPLFTWIAQAYEPDEGKRARLLDRSRFYRGTFALEEALDGFNRHDLRAYEHGMKEFI